MNRTGYPSVFGQKNLACGVSSYIKFACGAFFSPKHPACGTCWFFKILVRGAFDFNVSFGLPSHWY